MAIPIHHLGYTLRVWWPSEDGSCEPCLARLAQLNPCRKRKFLLEFSDGQSTWCSLDRKRLRFELALEPGWQQPLKESRASGVKRPLYIGSTDPGWIRSWMSRSLRSVLPMQKVDTYYMCVGGLSGLDSLLCIASLATPRRVVLFDRDSGAIDYAELMLALIQRCPSRADLMRALFGRCPNCWQETDAGCRDVQHCTSKRNNLSADSMLDFLQTGANLKFVRAIRQTLPEKLWPLYNLVVEAAAFGEDHDATCRALPRRRLWPCWGLDRRRRPIEEGLHGGGQETFHFGDTGWLADDSSYALLRKVVGCTSAEICCQQMDLNDVELDPVQPGYEGHVLFISNADENPKFLQHRKTLEHALSKQCTVLVISSSLLTLVSTEHEPAKRLAQREPEPRGEDNSLSDAKLRSLRRCELLRHLQHSKDVDKWRCPSAEDHLWRMTRLLSVL